MVTTVLVFDADEQELELFLAENNDHLQLLDQHIVELETQPDNQQLIQSIFRSAHTIKGAAGLIGHQRMAELSHDMENVLDALRSGKLHVSSQIVDALLTALDSLRVLNHEVVTRTASSLSLDGVRKQLAECLRPPAPVISEAAPAKVGTHEWPAEILAAAASSPVREGETLLSISVAVDPVCGLSAARTLQAYLELRQTSRILRAVPGLDQIEADEACHALHALVLSTRSAEEMQKSLLSIADVQGVTVTQIAQHTELKAVPETTPSPVAASELPAAAPVAAAGSAAPGPETANGSAAPAAAEEPVRQVAERRVGERRQQQDNSIRISVGIVDTLMSLVSELVLGRTRLQTLRSQLQERYPSDETVTSLEDAVGHLDQICNDMQATVMKARMVPVENVFNKFPRLVRDLANQSGKHVVFTTHGNETELDRSVIEQLSDPLTHLLRNAIDHAIESPQDRIAAGKPESGAVTLSASPNENHILIEIRDDGKGIDGEVIKAKAVAKGMISAEVAERMSEREAVELIFLAGLSTAKKVTDVSGRGVGMDIVKTTLERMGGRISIESEVGKGTTFSITLPLTLAIMQSLLVSVENTVFGIPLNLVTEILSVPTGRIHMMQGTEATIVRGAILPIVRVRDYFGYPSNSESSVRHLVAIRVDGQRFGLEVDRFIGEQEIVMKPLGAYIGIVPGLNGATILGDGRIGLLIDAAALRNWAPENRQALSA